MISKVVSLVIILDYPLHSKGLSKSLTIKRIPDPAIIKKILEQTNKTLSRSGLYRVRQSTKKESAKWYQHLRESEYEYIHEFKERIDEIMWLQKKNYEIIDSNPNNASIQQVLLAALHKLNVTLSNYFDVAPVITDTQQRQFTGNSIIEDQARTMFKIEGCTCPNDGRDIISHNKCRFAFVFGVVLHLSRIGVLTLNAVIA